MVFGFSAAMGTDKATPRRLVGLLVGLLGVGLVLWTQIEGEATSMVWLFVALLIPLILAIEVMMMAGFRPKGLDDIGVLAMMQCCAFVIVAPWALIEGQSFALSISNVGTLGVTMLLMAGVTIASYLMGFHLIKTAGAVFYSQTAYTMTIAGVVWGVLILNEQLSPLAWVAFAVIVIGMYLVEPKDDGKEIVIERKFSEDIQT